MEASTLTIDDRIADLAGVLNVANAQLVAAMESVLADESWSGPGVHSPTQWLAWKSGVHPSVLATSFAWPRGGPTSRR